MYTVQTQVKRNGAIIDQYTTPFGIRTFVFDPDKGFSINGQSMKLKGVCLHHDAGALGAAVPIQVWERRLKLLKDAGCNAIRCSHNPPAPEFLDLCDRMGFLVMDEAFDEWTQGKKKWIVGHNVGTAGFDGYHSDFDKWADIDIHDMVVRDRNHPSIILWSIGNEIDYQNDPYPPDSPELPPIAAAADQGCESGRHDPPGDGGVRIAGHESLQEAAGCRRVQLYGGPVRRRPRRSSHARDLRQ